jgi:indolepyruvate ferredoxin oxidoreductase
MPHFCSGCPHSISTRAPDDALVGAGIGCHTMIMLTTAGRGTIAGVTQMGGEGAQWIGIAPFIAPRHLLQNLGDGTYHHSGSLAIRAAIAANLNVTYKLLYNQTVAMTGGQTPTGQMSVAQIAREMEAEGVKRIIVTTEDLARYEGVSLPAIAEVRDRSRLMEAQEELAQIDGVTMLIHDQACATEVRRARKRGTLAAPKYRVVINERVCEGCGDCGAKSHCLSLEPVQTEFGRKTRIDQTSCNTDLSCIDGDCPAFMRVVAPTGARREVRPRLPTTELPEPVASVPSDDVRVRLVGIGGTGVVTVSQVLGMAALLDGHHAAGLDQTGLSQKAGPVVSDVRLSTHEIAGGVNSAGGHTDVLLGLDVVGSATARTSPPPTRSGRSPSSRRASRRPSTW